MNKGSEKMQEQLTFKKLVEFVDKNRNKIPLDTNIFIGNDDELNGIHNACSIANDTAWLIKFLKIKNTSKTKLNTKNNILIS
jgi:hypothetical protein